MLRTFIKEDVVLLMGRNAVRGHKSFRLGRVGYMTNELDKNDSVRVKQMSSGPVSSINNDANKSSEWDFRFFQKTKQSGRGSNNNSDMRIKAKKWANYSMPSKEELSRQQLEYEKKLDMAQEKYKAASLRVDEQSTADESQLKKKRKRQIRPRKALITLSPKAVTHLKALLDQPEPKLIRIGTKNRGCSGLTYDLQYITKPGSFDEIVEQDGVRVVIDSKALFSVVGSEMDWVDDTLSSKFVFKNPNSKGTCGCGESFMV